MKIKHQILALAMALAICVNCGDDGDQSVIFGVWRGQTIEYYNCDDPGNERTDGCPSDNCYVLELNSDVDKTYTLTRNFTGTLESEGGNYEVSGSSMTLTPTVPAGLSPYTFPIDLSGTQMTIEIPATDVNCTLRIVLSRD